MAISNNMPSVPERIYRRLTRYLPASVAVQLDLLHPGYKKTLGGPMNGQERRKAIVTDLFRKIAFDVIVETGTFRGDTTGWLHAVTKLPVISVELEKRFYLFAHDRLRKVAGVELHHGDSRAVLATLVTRLAGQRPFFYLDAHWNDDVPRHEELKTIQATWASAVVMIDDFLVPGDDGYGFARYGGHPLDERYLPDMGNWTMFYPSVPSGEETGARRGCALFASADLAAILAATPGLVRASGRPESRQAA